MFKHNRPTKILTLTTLLAIAAILLQMRIITLPASIDPFASPDLRQAPGLFTGFQLKALDVAPDLCARALAQAGLNAKLLPDETASPICSRFNTVQMSKLSTASVRPEQTRCNIEARLYMWERNVLQPLALKYFHQPIKEITHFGSYSCRTIAGSDQMSEHATANAFDISGFILRSGEMVSIKKEWDEFDFHATFLREARDGLCQYFNTVLSPDYNKAHADHFHVDMGWVRTCR